MAKTREQAEEKYNDLLTKRDEITEQIREAKRELDGFLEVERLSAVLGVPPEALEGQEIEVLKGIAKKAAEARSDNGNAVAHVSTVTLEGEVKGVGKNG